MIKIEYITVTLTPAEFYAAYNLMLSLTPDKPDEWKKRNLFFMENTYKEEELKKTEQNLLKKAQSQYSPNVDRSAILKWKDLIDITGVVNAVYSAHYYCEIRTSGERFGLCIGQSFWVFCQFSQNIFCLTSDFTESADILSEMVSNLLQCTKYIDQDKNGQNVEIDMQDRADWASNNGVGFYVFNNRAEPLGKAGLFPRSKGGVWLLCEDNSVFALPKSEGIRYLTKMLEKYQ